MTDLPELLPHGSIEEVLPDVFFVMGQTRPSFGGRDLVFSRSMTIVRDGTDLTLVNTMRLEPEGLAHLESLGSVRHVVKLGSFHGRDDAFYTRRYGAAMWSFRGMPHSRDVQTDHELDEAEGGPTSDAVGFRFGTSSTPEGLLLLARHGGVLLACDSLQNMVQPDGWFDEPTAQLMAAQGFLGPANIGPGWLRAGTPDVADFQRLKGLSFRHLLSAHGPPLLESAHEAVDATVQRVFAG